MPAISHRLSFRWEAAGPTLGLLAVLVLALPVFAVPRELLDGIPRESPAVVLVSPSASSPGSGPSVLGLLGALLEHGRQMGLLGELDERTRLILDLLGSVPTMARYPFALVLEDFQVDRTPGGSSRLRALQSAVIMNTGPEPPEAVVTRLQQLLNLHTNQEVSKVEAVEISGTKCFRLTDQRLPEWCVIEWGQVGPCYVVGVGRGSMAAIVEAHDRRQGLGAQSWFADAFQQSAGVEAHLQIYTDLLGIRHRFGLDSSIRTREGLQALHLDGVQRGLWSVRNLDRAVEVVSVLEFADRTERIPLTASDISGQPADRVVPTQARSYLVLARSARDLIERCRDLYLATQHHEQRERLRQAWLAEEARLGISFERDFLEQLGDRILFHTFPPHVLNLPFLCTVQVQITGSAEPVRRCLDAALARLNDIFPCELPGMTPDGCWLRRADDGIWYVQFGLVGPAVAVRDNWIVLSYSPQAVRDNLKLMDSPNPTKAVTP